MGFVNGLIAVLPFVVAFAPAFAQNASEPEVVFTDRSSSRNSAASADSGPSHELGTGKAVETGTGTGMDLGTGRGVDVGTGKGVDLGTGKGMDMGTGRGFDAGTERVGGERGSETPPVRPRSRK